MKRKDIQIYTYSKDTISTKEILNSIEEINEISRTEKYTWLNFHQILNDEEMGSVCKYLKIHPTTKDDIVYTQKRAKVEEYADYIFFSVTSVLPNIGKKLKTEQISFLLYENCVVSFQEEETDYFDKIRNRLIKNEGVVRIKKPDYLLNKLLESIIDNYFEVLEEIIAHIESIDLQVASNTDERLLNKIDDQKRKLIYLKRAAFPMKDIVTVLAGGNLGFLDPQNIHYFQNLKDECLSVLDEIETNKQILDGLSQLYYANLSTKMNEIMKVLTIIGAIFIPLTFIAGVYGMNFDNMPELRQKYAYFIVLGIMGLVMLGMIIYFRRKKWL